MAYLNGLAKFSKPEVLPYLLSYVNATAPNLYKLASEGEETLEAAYFVRKVAVLSLEHVAQYLDKEVKEVSQGDTKGNNFRFLKLFLMCLMCFSLHLMPPDMTILLNKSGKLEKEYQANYVADSWIIWLVGWAVQKYVIRRTLEAVN